MAFDPFKSGPDVDPAGMTGMSSAYSAYNNLINAGANSNDVGNATQAQRNLAQTYADDSKNPMNLYDFAAGKQLANNQFAPQRQQLAQNMQDQIAKAQQAAAAAGRSMFDPVMQSRMRGDMMRQTAALNSEESGAAIGYAGQIGQQKLQNQVNSTNTLMGLADSAFTRQQGGFTMSKDITKSSLENAQYEMSRGGGFMGTLTGIAGLTTAGIGVGTGIASMGSSNALANFYNQMSGRK